MNIELKNLSFAYKKKGDKVLNDISYCFTDEKIYRLAGINGSGKTTLVNLIMRLNKCQKNQIYVDEKDIYGQKTAVLSQKIGYLHQKVDYTFFAPTVIEELTFPYILTNTFNNAIKVRIARAIKATGLEGKEKRSVLTLSGGEKQRLAFATLLCRDLQFLILDEPTARLDGDGKRFVADTVNAFVNDGGGCIVITHDAEFIKMLNIDITVELVDGGLYAKT